MKKALQEIPGKGTLYALMLLAVLAIALAMAALILPTVPAEAPELQPTPPAVTALPAVQAYPAEGVVELEIYELPPIVNTTGIILLGLLILIIALGVSIREMRAAQNGRHYSQ